MTSTLLKDFKSKRACPSCSEKKLYTNDSEKFDTVVHYHCLNCGVQFSETEDQRELFKQKADKKGSSSSNSLGVMVILLLFAVILAVVVSGEDELNPELEFEPSGRLERLDRVV